MEVRLKEIKDRAKKATAGPWVSKKFGGYHHIYKGPVKVKGCGMNHGGEICEMEDHSCSDKTKGEIKFNAEFIAHARQDVPFLLDALQQSKDREQVLNKALEFYRQGSEQFARLLIEGMANGTVGIDKTIMVGVMDFLLMVEGQRTGNLVGENREFGGLSREDMVLLNSGEIDEDERFLE